MWSRSTGQSFWLSKIGLPGSSDSCVDYAPERDYVLTEIEMSAHRETGIEWMKATFSEDYGVVGEPDRQEEFEFGVKGADISS